MNKYRQRRKLQQNSPNHIVAIMAHPDDIDYIAGGFVHQMSKQGRRVTYILLTNGEKGSHDPSICPKKLAEIRQDEQRRAARVLGVSDIIFMNEADGYLEQHPRLHKRLVRQLRHLKPDTVICMNPDRYIIGDSYINHPDHRIAGRIVLEAIFPAVDNPMFYPELAEEGITPHKVKQVYIANSSNPNLQIDITDSIEQKIKALLCHRSQYIDAVEAETLWRNCWRNHETEGSMEYVEKFQALTLSQSTNVQIAIGEDKTG